MSVIVFTLLFIIVTRLKMRELVYFLVLSLLSVVYGQESVNAHEGINVGFHCGLALLLSFIILGTCAVGVNILTRVLAPYLKR